MARTATAPAVEPRDPDARAERVLRQMTLDEKLGLLHSTAINRGAAIGLAGFVPGIARLGIPALRETNGELGVAMPPSPGERRADDEATALPSELATAASWNPRLAFDNGAMIGDEARRKGFNVVLAGTANLARDPRAGRNFENAGEDPLLAGTMVGAAIHGIETQHVISTMKHFALNDQETDRAQLDARIDPAALRESDLLAFEIANEEGRPGAAMCAYNAINGTYACENRWLLQRVLRDEWGFRGWVMSDWGAVHSTEAAARAGLDQESGIEWDERFFFGAPLRLADATGELPAAQLDAMARRVLRSMFAYGLVDDPPHARPLDVIDDAHIAERAEDEGIVLLQNRGDILPLSPSVKRLAVIGGQADRGVLSGGGSSQVMPIGGPALEIAVPVSGANVPARMIFDPSSPRAALARRLPHARIDYADGKDPAAAAALARQADAAIVFATKWESEGHDDDDLELPDRQDGLIAAVAAANPRTIVVLETGNPVLMPWCGAVRAILEAWYPGARGGAAIADILVGRLSPSGRLPITFPATFPARAVEPPRRVPRTPGTPAIDYPDGASVGYKWYAAHGVAPLFPFGFGLTYTRFCYSKLRVSGRTLHVAFTVTNCGARTGTDIPQLYADVAGAGLRLVGWARTRLAPGESRRMSVRIDPRLLAHFDEGAQNWRIDGGRYPIMLGASARQFRLQAALWIAARRLPP